MNQPTFISRCRSILSDNNAPRVLTGQRSGSGIDEGRLALAPTGFNRLFSRKVRRKFSDYTICLLLDMSGSMETNNKYHYAVKAVHSLWYSLKQSGFRVIVYGFNDLFIEIPESTLCDMRALFSFVESNVYSEEAGYNVDGAAMLQAKLKLLSFGECGKICLVFSDGNPTLGLQNCGLGSKIKYPEYQSGKDAACEYLKKNIKEMRDAGITCLSVGILTDEPRKLYGEKMSMTLKSDELDTMYQKAVELLSANIVRG